MRDRRDDANPHVLLDGRLDAQQWRVVNSCRASVRPTYPASKRPSRERPVEGPASVLRSSQRFFAIKSVSRAVVSCVRPARVVPGAVPPGAEGVKGTTAGWLSSAAARSAAPSKARSDIEQEGSQCLCPTEF